MFLDEIPVPRIQAQGRSLASAFTGPTYSQNGDVGGEGHKLKLRPHKEAQNKTE
jgi:hypothetical protein